MAALLSSPFITPLYIRPPERTSEVFHQSFYGSFVSSVLNPQIPSSIARYGSKSVRCEVAGEGWRESFDRTMYKGIYGPWTIEPSDVREVVALVSRFWYPLYAKAALCQTCYRALRLNKALEAKAMELLNAIPKPFLSLHLRFEPDMVAYSQCDYPGLSPSSLAAIDSARGDRKPWTGDAAIAWRNRGKCPLTPNETAFILQSLSIPTNTNIYLAAGDGLMEIEGLTSSYTNVYSKSSFLDTKDFVNMHGNTKAALDYYVSINSDGYIATYFGNMDKMVSAMRVLNGMHKTLFLSRRAFANYSEKRLQGEELAEAMWREHLDDFVNGRGFALPDCFCEFKM